MRSSLTSPLRMLFVGLGIFTAIFVSGCTQRVRCFGFIDHSGKIVINLQHIPNSSPYLRGDIYPFSCDRALLWNRHEYMIIRKDSTLLSQKFSNARSFSQGLAAVCLFEEPLKWGYIDTQGRIVITPTYQQAGPFSNGFAAVKPIGQENWQFIDKAGRVVVFGPFEDVGKFLDGRAAVKVKGKWGFIDKSGNYVIAPEWHRVGDFHEGLAWLEVKAGADSATSRRVYVDTQGRNIFECQPKNWNKDPFLHLPVTASLPQGKLGGFCDEDKNLPFIESGDSHEGLIVRQVGDKYGYCDQFGKMKIAPRFDYAWHFSEGRAIVYTKENRGLLGYIDKNGEFVIRPKFKRANHFSEGVAAVSETEESERFWYHYIDRSGQSAFYGSFLEAGSFSSGRANVGEFKMLMP